jgi:chromosome segregation ATPase
MIDLDSMTRRFLLDESKSAPSLRSYVQALGEIINNLNPRSQTESRRIEIAKSHLKEIKRHSRKLEEKLQTLEEKLAILEEHKEDAQ